MSSHLLEEQIKLSKTYKQKKLHSELLCRRLVWSDQGSEGKWTPVTDLAKAKLIQGGILELSAVTSTNSYSIDYIQSF